MIHVISLFYDGQIWNLDSINKLWSSVHTLLSSFLHLISKSFSKKSEQEWKPKLLVLFSLINGYKYTLFIRFLHILTNGIRASLSDLARNKASYLWNTVFVIFRSFHPLKFLMIQFFEFWGCWKVFFKLLLWSMVCTISDLPKIITHGSSKVFLQFLNKKGATGGMGSC